MKTIIVKPTENLRNIVLYTRQFLDPVEVDSFEDVLKEKKVKVIVTAQNDLTTPDVIDLRNTFPEHKFLILTNKEDSFFNKACIAHDILLISSESSEREQLDAIQKAWFGLEEQTEFHNVIAFHGTHRQVGVTQLALSVGHHLGTLNYKTLVIGMNTYSSGEYPGLNPSHSFEDVYDFIESNAIHDGESLLPYLTKLDQMYYLVGNRDFYRASNFDSEPIEKLINFAKEYFHIVILDIGAFYDGFLAYNGLQMSNTHVLVSSQEQQSIDEYKRWKEQIIERFEIHPKSQYQVVNKYATRPIITSKHLEEKHNVQVLAEVPYFPEAADAVIEQGILIQTDNRLFIKKVEGLSKALANEVTEGQKPVPSGFFSRLFSKGE